MADRSFTKFCPGCTTVKGVRSFKPDGRTKDNLASLCTACQEAAAEKSMSAAEYAEHVATVALASDLPTETLEHVAVLSEGGPYYGTGSPPEGDYYTREDLEEIATANRELALEIKPPNKLGHNKAQRLLANSGMVADDELPAAGWLIGSSFEVEKADDGKYKLYVDIAKVPAKLAKLFRAGAFRTRSVELSRVTSQEHDGKVYENVVTGLAWLGAKAPAVRTLDDICALYANVPPDEGARATIAELLYADANAIPDGVTRVVDYAEPDDAAGTGAVVAWDPEAGFQDVLSDLNMALNPGGGYNFYASDVDVKLTRALVSDWANRATWIIPFALDDQGEPVPGPSSEWTLAEQAWVEASDSLAEKNFGEARKNRGRRDDTKVVTDPAKKLSDLSDEQIVTLAKTFGFDGDDAATLRPKLAEHLKAFDADGGEKPEATSSPEARKMAELERRAELGERAFEDRRIEKREAMITTALGSATTPARILPAQIEDWRKFYDATPELAEAQIKALPPLATERTYGLDDELPEGMKPEEAAKTGEKAYAEYAAMTGVQIQSREVTA